MANEMENEMEEIRVAIKELLESAERDLEITADVDSAAHYAGMIEAYDEVLFLLTKGE